MSENAVSYEHLLRLAHQRALDGKGGLAASVAKLCLDARADLSERELRLTFEILRMLIDKVEIAVRRNIADYLCDRSDVPKDLVAFLANDTVHVAYPILRSSPLLSDLDLIRLIGDHGHGHALAVATRENLSADVSGELIAMDQEAIDLTLARNLSARIARDDMAILIDRAIAHEALQSPLAHRGDLGDGLAHRLYTIVGEALRQHIERNYDIDTAALDAAVDSAVLDGLSSGDPLRDAVEGGWASQAKIGGGTKVLNRLLRDGAEGAALAFADQTHMPLETARRVFSRADAQTLAIALKAVGLNTGGYETALDILGQTPADGDVDRLLSYFDRIEPRTAAMVVNHWKSRPPYDGLD
jgi:uncharacterized protein (DUF2336 family)